MRQSKNDKINASLKPYCVQKIPGLRFVYLTLIPNILVAPSLVQTPSNCSMELYSYHEIMPHSFNIPIFIEYTILCFLLQITFFNTVALTTMRRIKESLPYVIAWQTWWNLDGIYFSFKQAVAWSILNYLIVSKSKKKLWKHLFQWKNTTNNFTDKHPDRLSDF